MMRLSRLGAESGRRSLLGIIALVIASAFVVSGCDRLTGGGWIESAALLADGKANFGFSAKCRNTTVDGVPVAELYDGQFQFDDRAFNPRVRIHGDIEPIPVFGTVVGQTCRQVASDLHLVPQMLSGFQGTYRTQPEVVPAATGEFVVTVFDGGEGGILDDDEICVDLAGGITYMNCGAVQGGNIQVN
jgi:hypothetical protein